MDDLRENILQAWVRMSLAVCDERIVSELSYNESLIFHLLYQRHLEENAQAMTATELCQLMRMQKSQMNRTLTHMEAEGFITRERSTLDKRQILVHLNFEKIGIYQKQHENILEIIDELLTTIGKDKAADVVRLFDMISDAAKKVIK